MPRGVYTRYADCCQCILSGTPVCNVSQMPAPCWLALSIAIVWRPRTIATTTTCLRDRWLPIMSVDVFATLPVEMSLKILPSGVLDAIEARQLPMVSKAWHDASSIPGVRRALALRYGLAVRPTSGAAPMLASEMQERIQSIVLSAPAFDLAESTAIDAHAKLVCAGWHSIVSLLGSATLAHYWQSAELQASQRYTGYDGSCVAHAPIRPVRRIGTLIKIFLTCLASLFAGSTVREQHRLPC